MLLQEKYTVLWEYIREIPNSDLGMAGWGWGGGEKGVKYCFSRK